MKRVFTAANLPEAQLLLDMLAAHGITGRILNANASSLAGELPVDVARPQIWIDAPAHATRALGLIDEYLRPRPPGPPQRCPKCGEESPSSFDVCWSCGAGLA